MLSIAYLVFAAFVAFAFPSAEAAFAWLGDDLTLVFAFATLAWPFVALVEGTIGSELYAMAWRKLTPKAKA